jgi:hypothetical protein
VAGHGGALRSAGLPQFTVDGHRAGAGLRRLRHLLLHRARLHQLPQRARPRPASRCTRADRGETSRSSSSGATRPSTPSRSPTSSTPRSSATASRPSCRSPTSSPHWKAAGRPGGRRELLRRLARTGNVYVPSFYDVSYLPDGRIQRVAPTESGVPWRVAKNTVMDLDEWPYPKQPLVPLAEAVHERMSVEIFRGCTRGCRFCQAGMITRPVRERSITGVGEMVERGLAARVSRRSGCSRCPAPTTPRSPRSPRASRIGMRGSRSACPCPRTRVDAFNIDLANELTRNGRRSGLTFAPRAAASGCARSSTRWSPSRT